MMKMMRYLLSLATAIALLSGCGSLANSPAGFSPSDVSVPQTSSGDLLYVANELAANGVTILTYPQGNYITTITNVGSPTGICSDASGNVWVSAYDDQNHKFYLYKFAHGGTKPIETLRVPAGAFGCAIDPTTSDLATWSAFAGSAGQVDVFPGARQGKPIVYHTDFEPIAGTYDNRGDIFADGIVNSGDFIFEELAGGSKTFALVRLNKPAINPGTVQWDGKYVTVGVGFVSEGPVLYRVHVSGNRGRVVGRVRLEHIASPARFWIHAGYVVASQRANTVQQIGLYDYPAGGRRLAVFSGFHNPMGMTVSVPPK